MTISIWQANPNFKQQPVREVDVLVVGAGLVGCAAAYFFRQAGREVVITEMRDIALGASGRNAGFMITGPDTYYHHAIERYGHESTRELWKLSERTHAIWRGFTEKDSSVSIEQSGSFLLAESEDEALDLEATARALQADGIPVIYHAHDPFNRGYYAAVEQPWDGAVQPYELAQAVFRASGAELVANNELYAIEQTEPDCVTVYTHRVIFRARYVLLCTNAYSPRIDPYFIGKVIPTRGQCLVTAPLPEPVMRGCGYSDYGYMYYRMTFDNRLLIGGGRKNYKALENDTTDDRTTPEVQGYLDAYLHKHFPDVAAHLAAHNLPIERRWAGIMGFSVDGLPLVGTLPGKPRVGFAVAFHGHGLALGAGTAERAVEFLLNGTSPGIVDAARLEHTA
ncbi:MAG: FAD-dependent oxidoreductase [bacterium]|nr:FAD-dependent oxidoreductase [bacterium]